MKIKGKDKIIIERNAEGVPKVIVKNETDLYFGMGYCHAKDRGIQMMLMRILGQGRGSEYLDSSDDMLEIDKFFRQMDWNNNINSEIAKFSTSEMEKLQAYCEGVNLHFSKSKPWELKMLLGYNKFDWKIEDIILMSRMAGFLTLAQSQGEIERLFIEMVQNGATKEMLNELFPNILDNYNEEIVKKIKLKDKIVPEAVKWNSIINPMMASNNWVISGKKTKSNSAILSNDPHLEINRLPPVWYEISFVLGEQSAYSSTMPGISSLLIGRNKNLAWGATYTFMDAIDSWVEDCKEGKYLKDEEWHSFKERKEIIKRKNKTDIELTFFENEHGVLEGNPFEDGYYLTTLWSGKFGGARSIKSGLSLWNTTNVKQGMECLGGLEMSFNWVLADTQGNIGYQMSGLLPKRKKENSGFVPLIGWNSENDWNGFHTHDDLPKTYNPKEEMFVTANENLSQYGKVNPHTIAMGKYRSDRIKKLLAEKDDFTVDDIKKMHYDVYSIQAEIFMEFIKGLLPENENGNILKNWDYCYDTNSKGAYLFEQIYRALYSEIFGKIFGKNVNEFLQNETGIFVDFYENFDNILLAEESVWFVKKSKTEIYRNAIEKALKNPAKTWGEVNQFELTNMLLGGKLPKFLGFDKGAFPMPGGRATIHQGQVYKSNGRKTTFAPSFRLISDMSEEIVYTNISGGASDRRFSKYYANDFKNWQSGKYKKIRL
jgi:penicillin amidase